MKILRVAGLALGLSFAAGLCIAAAQPVPAGGSGVPHYDAKGNLLYPADYREWVFLSSGFDMAYKGETGPAPGSHLFLNVFVPQAAYRAFLKMGTWPDKTMLMMEHRVGKTNVSINIQGAVQTQDLEDMAVHVKDAARFKDMKGWAFFNFNPGDKTGSKFPLSAGCNECHEKNGAVDTTFVQFYPTLIPVAIARGTFKPPPGDAPSAK
jgi:hypothetical protein